MVTVHDNVGNRRPNALARCVSNAEVPTARCAGALLRVLQQDSDLAGFSHVVVDEAQQRTCLQDVGLAALR